MSTTLLGLTLAMLASHSGATLQDRSRDAAQSVDGQRQDTAARELFPDSVPRALFKALGKVSGRPLPPGDYIKDIVIIDFDPDATAAQRRAALDAVSGTIVGGERYPENPSNGTYYVRVTGGTASSLLHAVMVLQGLPQVSFASAWPLTRLDRESARDEEPIWFEAARGAP